MKEYIIFIANYWGATSGGISTFNYDLARAVAKRRKEKNQITVCLLLNSINDVEKKEIQEQYGLKLISLLDDDNEDYEDTIELPSFLKGLKKMVGFREKDNIIWVGHDIKTGNYANICKNEYGGKSLVFSHMNYSEYYYLATGDEEKEEQKESLQKRVLQQADWVCAVGPVLKDYAEDIRHEVNKNDVSEFIPGMLEVEPATTIPNTYKILFFGRIDKKNNYVKQPKLAIAAFAKAYDCDIKQKMGVFKNNPRMEVYGYSKIDDDDKEDLKNLVREYTTDTLNITPRKYVKERDKLREALRTSSLCIMVSRHEGFGLAAYEAISAGVPIIISDNTGLDRFLKTKKGQPVSSLYKSVHIEGTVQKNGRPSRGDLDTVSKAILAVLENYKESKDKALSLRTILVDEQFTWDNQAVTFLNLIHNLQEQKTGTSEEICVDIWEKNVTYTDLKQYIAYEFLPNMCTLLLGSTLQEYSKYVQCALVRFDETRGKRQTLVTAGIDPQNKGKIRELDEGVVGIMIEQNSIDGLKTSDNNCKPIFYDFYNAKSYVLIEGEVVEFTTNHIPGRQDDNVRAILAFPLAYEKQMKGAVTLDFYNLAQLKLENSLDELQRIMCQGSICMQYLVATIFNNYNDEMEDN